jgi:hypothetical protein
MLWGREAAPTADGISVERKVYIWVTALILSLRSYSNGMFLTYYGVMS